MSGFITLGHAARLLAGDTSNASDSVMWQALLIDQAEALKAIKTWSDYSGMHVPGGISFLRSPEDWRLPLASFLAWCEREGYPIAHRRGQQPPAGEEQTRSEPANRRARQIARILESVQARGWEALRIPNGGKQKIKAHCLEEAALFTEAGFARAWQAAINEGFLRTENHTTYAKR